MTAVVNLHEWQGSPEWHEYRRRMGNASETGALMNCSPFFPRTPYELWLYKSGRLDRDETPAMRRGLALEPRARAWVEARLGLVFEPQVVARERLSASLDGLSFDGRRMLELKCPAAGRASELWAEVAREGRPPEHYWWQVQQGLYCSGAEGCHFAVCHEEDGEIVDALIVQVAPDPVAHSVLEAAWAGFLEHLDADVAPPLSERDVQERQDVAWRDAVSRWKEARNWLEEARRAEAEARAALIEAAGERSVMGFGLKLTRYFRRGEIDWRAATRGMDLEPFRRDGAWLYRISEQD